MNAIPSASYVVETRYVWSMSLSSTTHSTIAHVRGQGLGPHPGPLEKSGNDPEIYPLSGFAHPTKTVTALVEETNVNDGMIHQVLSNPRKVHQRSNVMECKLGSWSDTRQHQNLYTDVTLSYTEGKMLPA